MKRQLSPILTLAGLAFLVACKPSPPVSDQPLQERVAQATESAKQQSKEAVEQARQAAANAEQTVNDVAAGVKQGMRTGSPRLNINSASPSDLDALPGISSAQAAQIVQHRPYTYTHDLVKAGVLTERQFEAIAPKITAQQP